MLLIPKFRRQKQAALYEFKARHGHREFQAWPRLHGKIKNKK